MTRLDLGVGIVAVAGLDLIWEEIDDVVDTLEVEPQNFWQYDCGNWAADTDAYDWLLGCCRPIICHGVGFPVGGLSPPDPQAVELFRQACHHLGAVMASEHLSVCRTSGQAGTDLEAGFLLPPRQTHDVVGAATDNIGTYMRGLEMPFLVETGTNYLRPDSSELSDGQFFSAVTGRAECGLLLDLHNLWANEKNSRWSVEEVLDELPVDQVLEIHVAGGFELAGMWLDSHSGPLSSELIALLEHALSVLPNVRAVVFEILPEYLVGLGGAGVRAQLATLHKVVSAARRSMVRRRPSEIRSRRDTSPTGSCATQNSLEWERAIVQYTTRKTELPPSDDPGFGMLRLLTDNARLGRVSEAAPAELRRVLRLQRERGMPLIESYLSKFPTHLSPKIEAQQFRHWMNRQAISGT